MSTPITNCLISKAARGDDAAYTTLRDRMAYNLKCGHWSQWPCECNPKCPTPTAAELDALNTRLTSDISNAPRQVSTRSGDNLHAEVRP